MAPALAWLDHDTTERDRMNRILALFQERDTRDELGIGTIRDLLADTLFPGTSTIQTRLRYMLFVPWVYKLLEEEGCSSAKVSRVARDLEVDLVTALTAGDDTGGIFGRRAGGKLERLPSAVYWSGLSTWGILKFDGSQDRYHASFDQMHEHRRRRKPAKESAERRGEGADTFRNLHVETWHAKLPQAPEGFPDTATIGLTREEAQFIQDQIVHSAPDSLLARLAWLDRPADAAFPWEHPQTARFTEAHRELLEHARLLSQAAYGAAILYNLLLAEQKKAANLVEQYRSVAEEWLTELDYGTVAAWSLDWTRPLEAMHSRPVPTPTREFVLRWLRTVCNKRRQVFDDPDARSFIRAREMRLKGPRSRFTNARSLDQWGGDAMMNRLNFRWPTVTRFMQDLHSGLGGDHA